MRSVVALEAATLCRVGSPRPIRHSLDFQPKEGIAELTGNKRKRPIGESRLSEELGYLRGNRTEPAPLVVSAAFDDFAQAIDSGRVLMWAQPPDGDRRQQPAE